jgi:glycerate dehydrogenase
MRCAVLDGYTLNPGDLSWSALEALLPCTIYPRTPPGEVVERARDAEVVLVNKVVLSAPVLGQLPRLRYVGVLATGYNCVDVSEARRRGITATNVPVYGTQSVAQTVFAHLLHYTQSVALHAQGVAAGRWTQAADWCYWERPLIELAGRTMGIVGFGRIGRATAALARAFGMPVLACDAQPLESGDLGTGVDLDTLFRDSDVISLHCPLTAQTRHLVNRQRLASMKTTAYLINTSRGALIDEPALAEALNAGRIAGAGLDVLSEEPPPADHPLLRARNCTITPHVAWATREARQRLLDTAVENVRAFLAGHPQNLVDAAP